MNIIEQLKLGITTQTEADTIKLAKELAQSMPANSTIALDGAMGSGKTTFVKGFAKGLHIEEGITSPTFNIFNTYNGKAQLVHVDAYRIENEAQAENLLLDEFLESPYFLIVEWPEKLGSTLSDISYTIEFSINPDHTHHIKLINFKTNE